MAEYILFLDETLKNNTNPYFCLAGLSITREDYEKILIPSINSFKRKYFGDTSVIFHFTEMKKNSNEFSILRDGAKRTKFWQELHAILRNIPMITLGCYFDSAKMKSIYTHRDTSEYSIALHYVVENYIHQLRNVAGVGSIMLESRTMKENQKLHDYFHSIEDNGTLFYAKDDVRKYLSAIGYIIKQDNCVGLQIADLIPTSLIRVINGNTDFFNYGNLWLKKLYGLDKGQQDILGLKKIL